MLRLKLPAFAAPALTISRLGKKCPISLLLQLSGRGADGNKLGRSGSAGRADSAANDRDERHCLPARHGQGQQIHLGPDGRGHCNAGIGTGSPSNPVTLRGQVSFRRPVAGRLSAREPNCAWDLLLGPRQMQERGGWRLMIAPVAAF